MENLNTIKMEQPWTLEGNKESMEVKEGLVKFLSAIDTLKEKVKNDPDAAALYSGLFALGTTIAMTLTQPDGWKQSLGAMAIGTGMVASLAAKVYGISKENK